MKIVLSRKGFDSKAGGVPSPIFEDGSLVSLPIPYKTAPITFDDVAFGNVTLGPIVEDLTGGRIKRSHPVHLDPDLVPSARPRRPGWRPLFGQTDTAQAHLASCGVGEGDLFLFFGWFRKVH